jgi:hypothetical protein
LSDEFLFVEVGGEGVHGLGDVGGDSDPLLPLPEGYRGHFSVDSLLFNLTFGDAFGCFEDLAEVFECFFTEFLSAGLKLVSCCFDAARNISVDGDFDR